MIENTTHKCNTNHSLYVTKSDQHVLDVVKVSCNFNKNKSGKPFSYISKKRMRQKPYNKDDQSEIYSDETTRKSVYKMKKLGYILEPRKRVFIYTGTYEKEFEEAILEYNNFIEIPEKYQKNTRKIPDLREERILEKEKNLVITSNTQTGNNSFNPLTSKNNFEEANQNSIQEKCTPRVLAYEDGIAYINKLESQEASLNQPRTEVATATQVAHNRPETKQRSNSQECAASQAPTRVTQDDVLELLLDGDKFIFKTPTGFNFTATDERKRKQKFAIYKASQTYSLREIYIAIQWIRSGVLSKFKGKFGDTYAWFTTANMAFSKLSYANSGKLGRLVETYREYCQYVMKKSTKNPEFSENHARQKTVPCSAPLKNMELGAVMGSLMGNTFVRMRT